MGPEERPAPHGSGGSWSQVCSYRKQLEAGHRFVSAEPRTGPAWVPRTGSHDDGPLCGLFLGGIGAPVVGRNLDGSFGRWHLQNGYHVNQAIEQALFSVRWAPGGNAATKGQATRGGYLRLQEQPAHELPRYSRDVLSLFPVIHEHYHGQELPLEVVAEFYSPLLPEHTAQVVLGEAQIPAATLPLFVASLTVRNACDHELSVDTACFWPNLLGWRLQQCTTLDRAERSWPGQTHAGNSGRALYQSGGVAALQTRHTGRPVNDELMGEVAVYSPGPREPRLGGLGSGGSDPGEGERATVEACCKAGGNKIDRLPEQQGHTFAWMEEQFRLHGRLPETGLSWTAHWDEALCSAVSRGAELQPGESRRFTFVVVFDLPLVRFGDGRRWYRTYTSAFGSEGHNAMQIARYAAENHERWRAALDEWHRSVLGASPGSMPLAGAMLNELYFMNGGGSVWVNRWAHELDTELSPPSLGPGEHCAVIEGYDIGYYYYNTTDLWPYAWYAVWRWWPSFARNVFTDLLRTVPLEMPHKQMIYRSESMEPLLVVGKIPHDIGAAMEDPWHRLNGYQMRDDSNLWKDHNPSFILSLYLERRLSGDRLTEQEWPALRQAGIFMLEQADVETALPFHQAFGDSTWDNLGIRGYASYSAGFTLGSLAVLATLAEQFGDHELATEARRRLGLAQMCFVERLWNGEYYRICDRGTYTDCLMGDGILGVFLADLAGLGKMLDAIPRASLQAHLEACYRYSFLQYCEGTVGPLLVAAPGRTRFAGDGGDELQVNEVLLGSAWACVAMMEYYGLEHEAQEIAGVLVDRVYASRQNGRGLQFRTPAAMDGEGRFRAPLNMRPLSIWLLEAARRAQFSTDTSVRPQAGAGAGA